MHHQEHERGGFLQLRVEECYLVHGEEPQELSSQLWLHHFRHHVSQEAHHPELIDMKKKRIHQINIRHTISSGLSPNDCGEAL
jgi:hypothetical protein